MPEKKGEYEKFLNKLASIADSLEGGNLTLEESMKKYEEGMTISKKLDEMLKNAEGKIKILNDGKEKDFLHRENEDGD